MHHDLIVFGEDWGGLPSSTQHLIKHLAKTRKVIWINSIGLRRPTLSYHDLNRCCQKLLAAQANNTVKVIEKPDNMHIIAPRTLPAPRNALTRWLAVQLLLTQIKPIIKKMQLHAPILWTSLPTAVDFAGHLNEAALVYYCGDDFSGLAGVDHQTVVPREQALLEKADLIMASSPLLAQRSDPSRTQLLTHGVDYTLFATPATRAIDLPDNGRNIAGFYGSISEWLDLDLLEKTIAKMDDWYFVFIGKVIVDISRLTRFKNVIFLGPRPHHLLPSYSQHWTASLLPFVDNAQIRACNPLKLSEYLATGTPIISTSFPAVQPFHESGLVQVADSAAAMVEALRASEHAACLPHFSSALSATVAKHSWSARAEQVATWLERL